MIKEFPDKILLVKDDVIEDYWVLKNSTQCEDVEYIRKDIVDDMLITAEDQAYLAGQETMKEKLTKLEEMADKMYYAAQYLTTDASKLRKAMRDYWRYVVYELNEE